MKLTICNCAHLDNQLVWKFDKIFKNQIDKFQFYQLGRVELRGSRFTWHILEGAISVSDTMAEGTYEYECMRAELLGVDKPDYEEFLARRKEEARSVESEAVETENLVVTTRSWSLYFAHKAFLSLFLSHAIFLDRRRSQWRTQRRQQQNGRAEPASLLDTEEN